MPTLPDTESGLTFPILIGDIGGTNARFALLIDAFAEPKLFPIIPTTSYASIEEALQTSILDKTSVQPRSAIIAVAGPVKGDDIPLTNAGWVIKPKDMLTALSLEDVIIINDFRGPGARYRLYRRRGPRTDRLRLHPRRSASCAVLGPGTGLGVAGLVHAQHTWFPVPGEGGHVVGPRTGADYQIWPFLEPIEGRISAEQLLCGRGIVNIYRAVCGSKAWNPELADPAAVTHQCACRQRRGGDGNRLLVFHLSRPRRR